MDSLHSSMYVSSLYIGTFMLFRYYVCIFFILTQGDIYVNFYYGHNFWNYYYLCMDMTCDVLPGMRLR